MVLTYIACWHVALVVVLALDGTLTSPAVTVSGLAAEYAAALPYLLRPGGELPTYIQLLAVVLSVSAFTAQLFSRLRHRTPSGSRPV